MGVSLCLKQKIPECNKLHIILKQNIIPNYIDTANPLLFRSLWKWNLQPDI